MNNYINYENNMLLNFNGLHSVDVKGQSNLSTKYHKRYLYNKIYSCLDFDFKGQKWDLNSFRWLLIHWGNLAFYNHPEFGWIYGTWSPKTYNIYMNPSTWNFQFINKGAVPQVTTIECDESNSVIIKMFDDYIGFDDLVSDTAVKLALADRLTETAMMNANVNLIGYADTKKQAEEIKTAYSNGTSGEPVVIVNRKLKEKVEAGEKLLEPFTNHDTALSLDRILTSRRTILNNFLTEVGIKNANFQKKERLITDEVNSNNEEVSSNITIAYNNIKRGFEEFNKLSGLNISVDLHFDYMTENDMIVNEEVGSDV